MQRARVFVQIFCILLILYHLTLRQRDQNVCIFDEKHSKRVDELRLEETIPTVIKKNVAARIKGRQQLIPYIIHQTNEADAVPAGMMLAIENLIERNPQYAYRFYNKTERRELIQTHFGSTVLAVYDKLVPGAFKADLFRYTIVYVHGGCYFDSGIILNDPLRNFIRPTDRFLTAPDNHETGINNAFYCCEAKHPILDLTIRRIVRVVANEQRGSDFLNVTGPHLMAVGFREYFNFSYIIQDNFEYPNGVRTLEQQIQGQCRIYQVADHVRGFNLSYNKYPNYYADTTPFINQVGYSIMWENNNTYDRSITVVSDGNYSTEPTFGKE